MHIRDNTLSRLLARFRREETGLALTEYLILLGLLTVLTMAAVLVFGQQLAGSWYGFAVWLDLLGPRG